MTISEEICKLAVIEAKTKLSYKINGDNFTQLFNSHEECNNFILSFKTKPSKKMYPVKSSFIYPDFENNNNNFVKLQLAIFKSQFDIMICYISKTASVSLTDMYGDSFHFDSEDFKFSILKTIIKALEKNSETSEKLIKVLQQTEFEY